MKKSIPAFVLLLLTGGISVSAQGGGFQRQTPEERVKRVHFKIDSAFKLDAEKMTKADTAFLEAYIASDKVREDMRSGGGQPDREAMLEKIKPINEARDAKLKMILGDDNYKIWKDQIEPAMRVGRGSGGDKRPQ